MLKYVYTSILVLLVCISSKNIEAQSILSKNAEISILTSYPSKEDVYTIFGHSAMRVHDAENNIDLAFNYGIFDFDSPNFIYRFCTGETDYLVVPFNYIQYISSYTMRGVKIKEQFLNLEQTEKQAIWEYLLENIKPENREYRYNIFYDNCTTRLLDIIEESTEGTVNYPKLTKEEKKTFRQQLHEHLIGQDWLRFGIDLIIGSDADREVTECEMMFLPLYEYAMLNDTKILRNGIEQDLIEQDTEIAGISTTDDETQFFLSPLVAGILILILSLFFIYLQYLKKKSAARIFSAILFIIAGLAGCIIFFLMFFSVHSCTDSNWNLLWLHPLHLLAGIIILVKPSSKCLFYYHFINFALLVLILLAWTIIPQYMEYEFVSYIISLILVSASHVYYMRLRIK